MIGQTISHYRITGQLGSGGMGVVYEAQDLTLGRRVALKFLPSDVARDSAALDRFLFEARAASALNHPNICTIYAVENSDGQSFIAMELLEGQSLDYKLLGPPLPLDRLLDISIQLAEALEAAHAKVDKGGPVLGVLLDADYERAKIDLHRGEVLVLYTDGVVEAENPAGEQYSTQRLVGIVSSHLQQSPAELNRDDLYVGQRLSRNNRAG